MELLIFEMLSYLKISFYLGNEKIHVIIIQDKL